MNIFHKKKLSQHLPWVFALHLLNLTIFLIYLGRIHRHILQLFRFIIGFRNILAPEQSISLTSPVTNPLDPSQVATRMDQNVRD